ncbi:nucleolar zinc-finger protein [Conglomerata obtusa]
MQNTKRTTESPIISEDSCPRCTKIGYSRILKINIPNEAPTYISSFTCAHCDFSHRQIHDGDIGDGTGIKIECHFNCQDDLKRTIRMSKFSTVHFCQDGHEFEYGCGQSGITIVEAIIRDLIGDLGGIFDLNTSTDSVARLDGRGSSASSSRLSSRSTHSTSSFLSVMDKKDAKKQIFFLKNMLSDPKFSMIIEDKTGLSRVAPVGKLVGDMEAENLDNFNDERVKHENFMVEIEGEDVDEGIEQSSEDDEGYGSEERQSNERQL